MSRFVDAPGASPARACTISSSHVDSLRSRGYAIVDGFLGEEWSSALRAACIEANERGDLSQHHFRFGKELHPKPNIFELDLHDEAKRTKCKELVYLFDQGGPEFVKYAQAELPFLNLDDAPSAIKLQFNAGKGKFSAALRQCGSSKQTEAYVRGISKPIMVGGRWRRDCAIAFSRARCCDTSKNGPRSPFRLGLDPSPRHALCSSQVLLYHMD